MNNKNFVPINQKNKKPILEHNNRTEHIIQNNFEMPEYLDYQEKNFYQKFMLNNILLKEQNNN